MSEPHQVRLSTFRLAMLGGSILLVPAIRALYVGYPSFEPVLLARIDSVRDCWRSGRLVARILARRQMGGLAVACSMSDRPQRRPELR
jgi:hypothetical protein